MIALERLWFRYTGIKEQRIREDFNISRTLYYLRLNRLIQRPEAMAFDPFTVKRLLKIRLLTQVHRAS